MYSKRWDKRNYRTKIAGRPRPVRREVQLRARRKTFEFLALLALAVLIGLVALLLIPH